MRFALFFILLLTVPQFSWGTDGYTVITAPVNRKPQIYLAPATSLSGPSSPAIGSELTDLLAFDLDLAGLFGVAPPASGGIGADLTLKSAYAVNGAALTLECRLFDQILNRELAAKRYTGNLKELRRMGHAFAEEVLRALTGEKGPFTGKIAYVTKLSGNKEIFVMDYDGRNPQRVTNNGSINLNPDFAPSGKEIIYTSYKKGNPDLYRRELFTGFEARVSARSGLNAMGAWSPDGTRIALVMTKDGNSEIYLISKEG